jgi:alpha-methylacyl-CoA racemase
MQLIGRPGQKPTIPLNLLGDFGGGSLIMFSALLLALMQRQRTGRGQVIDLSMTTGLVYLSTYIHEMKPVFWPNGRGENPLDGAAPFYDCYECSDGKYLAVYVQVHVNVTHIMHNYDRGAVEPKFYQKFIDCLVQSCGDITNTDDLNMLYHSGQHDAQKWPAMKRLIEQCLMTKTRDEWLALFDPLDCCVNAVMEWDELESRLPQGTFDKSTDGRLIPRFPVKSKL